MNTKQVLPLTNYMHALHFIFVVNLRQSMRTVHNAESEKYFMTKMFVKHTKSLWVFIRLHFA